MVDYLITRVRYHDKRIAALKVCQVLEDADYTDGKIGEEETWSRTDVISAIHENFLFMTAIYDAGRNIYHEGATVDVIPADGGEYLRTDGNSKAEDNLGELPKF